MRFIGDIHGKLGKYKRLLKDCDQSVQIGDFGIGFLSEDAQFHIDRHIHAGGNHRFIRGNHDDPGMCQNCPGWIADGTVEGDVMYVGGAWSIDWQHRTPGYSWWYDEELSDPEFERVHFQYMEHLPRIMVTHDAPRLAIAEMFNPRGPLYQTRTGEWFDKMFHEHQPDIWIFGHWHADAQETINGTKFICLDELSFVDIDI